MQVLNVVSMIIMILGTVGVVSKSIRKRILGISLNVIGLLLLTNCQKGMYGFCGGVEALLMQLPTWILFLILTLLLCKKNGWKVMEDMSGFRNAHPYVFVLYIVIGLLLIGIPGSGTFAAYMIAVNAIIGEKITAFTYIGLLAMGIGIGLLVVQFFDLWIHMLIEKVPVTEENIEEQSEEMLSQKPAGISKILCVITSIVLLVLLVFGIWQTPLIQMIVKLYGMIK